MSVIIYLNACGLAVYGTAEGLVSPFLIDLILTVDLSLLKRGKSELIGLSVKSYRSNVTRYSGIEIVAESGFAPGIHVYGVG